MAVVFEPFETARLTIRQLVEEDARELTAISDDARVSRWMSFMEDGFPLAKAQGLIAAQSTSNESFFAVRTRNRTLVGALATADHSNGTIEFGYWFGVDYQGNGYAYEAVRGMLERIIADPLLASRPIIAETLPDNAASIKLLTKAGLVATGRPGHRPDRIEFAMPVRAPSRTRHLDL